MKFPKKILDELQKYLSAELEKIKKNLSSLKLQDPFSDPDRLIDNAASDTEAKEESSHERMEALEKELKIHFEEVKQALERVNRGTYGKCFSCKKMIDTDRLGAKPTALYCVECERKKEK
ncbi:TraR/DksA C4-type zinc finger protein [Candidatus Microgenomates bacterium]|nr:TraR/DksA C4-type zinc finger protein [Candidatus Microgenomates bacterium]